MLQKYISYAIVILTALTIVVALFLRTHTKTLSRVDFQQLNDAITRLGPEAAYKEFKKALSDFSVSVQHPKAHLMGILLYENVGLNGITICDESFTFGCFHGFFGRVIADRGTAIIPALAEACRTRYGRESTGCEHGIGHGIMEYTGREGLATALKLCDATKQEQELFGCTSGLFMEYNSAMLIEGDVVRQDIRKIDAENPRKPCDSLETPFRRSCYFEIALWWKQHFGNDYERIGNLCTDAPNSTDRDACYQGWGTVVAEQVNYDPGQALETCTLIVDARGRDVCAFGVASRSFPAGHPDAALKVCQTLPQDLKNECATFSK